jgi:replicative DNA helicase
MIPELDLKILKTIVSDKIVGLDFANTYNLDLFANDVKLFARHVLTYMKAYRNVPTRRVLKEWAGEAYVDEIDKVWNSIDALNYSTNEYPFDLERFKIRYIDESIKDVKNICINTNGDPNKTIKDISTKLQNVKLLQYGKSFTHRTVKDYADESEERYRAKLAQPGKEQDYILTHYSGIDFAIGGLKPADLVMIAGETGAGKSTLLMNLGIQVWLQKNTIETPPSEITKGNNVTFFSLEMPFEECYSRLISRLAKIPERAISDGSLTSEERKRMVMAERFIKNYPYEFDIIDMPRGVNTEIMELRYADALLKYEPNLVLVDYLGLMRGGTSDQDWLKIGEIAGELHEFGRAYSVAMGTALQLNDAQRGTKTDPKDKSLEFRVGPHRIGRSSMILHHATLGIQIESKPGSNEDEFMTYHIIKNRRGPKISAKLWKQFEVCSLNDIQYIHKLKNKHTNENKEAVESPDMSDISGDRLEEARDKINKIRKML